MIITALYTLKYSLLDLKMYKVIKIYSFLYTSSQFEKDRRKKMAEMVDADWISNSLL